jgi:hypothetical protein
MSEPGNEEAGPEPAEGQGRSTALPGVDTRRKRADVVGPPEGGAGAETPGRGTEAGATPREAICVCQGCGAIGRADGGVLDNKCRCKDGAKFEELALASDASVTDPTTGYPNEYAKRVKQRNLADTAYLLLQERRGHAVAAMTVCRHFGHDPSSGFCMRCGGRVGRDYED